MAEQLTLPELTLDAYQDFVLKSLDPIRYAGDWQTRTAAYIEEEVLEFLVDHGSGGTLFLMPDQASLFREPHKVSELDMLRYEMAGELGDMLWFGTMVIAKSGSTLEKACAQAIKRSGGVDVGTPAMTFQELQTQAQTYSRAVSVSNKIGELLIDSHADLNGQTSFQENPYYVLIRSTRRLTRALRMGNDYLSPPGLSDLEPLQDIISSAGNYINTLALISADRLGIGLEDIARYNIKKLKNRELYGKENDTHFGPEDVVATH